jgi:hypothetical protein
MKNDEKIDFVFPYVNCNDPVWLEQYKENNKNIIFNPLRFRAWGLLKYVFRGIDKFMPWINNVYMIVSSDSQIPAWINKENVKIITHKQIIPKEFLPTFNSTTIEMFLKNIPNLSEKFIYSNDDLYFINKLDKSDFFYKENIPKLKLISKNRSSIITQFRRVVLNEQIMIAKDFNYNIPNNIYYKPQHLATPMLKTTLEKVCRLHDKEIKKGISKTREEKNHNQYIYTFYQYFSGRSALNNINGKYMDFGRRTASDMAEIIKSGEYEEVCINDGTIEIDFEKSKEILQKTFEQIFKDKSKYEI